MLRPVRVVASLVLVVALGTALAAVDRPPVGATAAQAAHAPAGATAAQAAAPTLKLRTTSLGRIVVDGRGRTLYLFEKDRNGRSACSGDCARAWPPLIVTGSPTGATGIVKSKIGTVRRASGKRQVTYAGHPLYRYVGDTKAGQVNGQGSRGFGAGWYVLRASGKKVDSD